MPTQNNPFPSMLDAMVVTSEYITKGRLPVLYVCREVDEEEVLAASPHLDLAALVEDEAILALPMAPAHVTCEWHAQARSDRDDVV